MKISQLSKYLLKVAVIIFVLGMGFSFVADIINSNTGIDTKRQIAISKAWRARLAEVSLRSSKRDTVIIHIRERANNAIQVADSIHAELSDRDTTPIFESTDNPEASFWRRSFTLRTQETDSLRSAYDAQQQINIILAADRNMWKNLAFSGDSVIHGNMVVMERSVCRVLFIPCPSRTTMFVTGIIVGFFVVKSFHVSK